MMIMRKNLEDVVKVEGWFTFEENWPPVAARYISVQCGNYDDEEEEEDSVCLCLSVRKWINRGWMIMRRFLFCQNWTDWQLRSLPINALPLDIHQLKVFYGYDEYGLSWRWQYNDDRPWITNICFNANSNRNYLSQKAFSPSEFSFAGAKRGVRSLSWELYPPDDPPRPSWPSYYDNDDLWQSPSRA